MEIVNGDERLGNDPCGIAGAVAYGARYRGFLMCGLAYYLADVAWGMFAGLGWTDFLHVETAFFFLALVAFVVMWSRFVVAYLGFGKWPARVFLWCGYALLVFDLAALAANPFTGCFYHFDAQGGYQTGLVRDLVFVFLGVFNALLAAFVFVKSHGERGAVHHRSMMVFMFCLTLSVSMALQVVWPQTSFTAFGCFLGNCFFHVFAVQEEQSEEHATGLEKALARARAAEKSSSMIFSIVSHDIRTPLNAILGYAELLQGGIKSQAERDEALGFIRASGTTLLQLVNDVLDLAKMDAGKMMLRAETVLLSRLTDEVFASFRLAAAEKGVSLVNMTAGVPAILLDAHRFRQVLFNLVGNAVKFTARGSVTVAASYANTQLEVTVSDTGCGIPPDMLAHVLDPFVKVQDLSHLADRDRGTGLGLSICRSLVEMMGGKLFVESELGSGSTFTASIPGVATSGESPALAAGPKPASASKNLPKRVLVVDDSLVNRLVLTAFLKRAGVASIDQAGDGKEALEMLDSAIKAGSPYDFVFSDFWMPNMSGFEFIEKLQGDSRFSRLPVFAVTADTESRHDARADLFTGVLLKPLTYDKLMEAFSA